MSKSPKVAIRLNELPDDERVRHEAFVAAFGQYLFWIRNSILNSNRDLVESPEAREQLATLFREPFDRAAELAPPDREVAYELAKESIDNFAVELLRLFAHAGFDLPTSDEHVVRFRVVMEICNGTTGEVVAEEVVNRGGRHFADYWGRWLNRFGSSRRTD